MNGQALAILIATVAYIAAMIYIAMHVIGSMP